MRRRNRERLCWGLLAATLVACGDDSDSTKRSADPAEQADAGSDSGAGRASGDPSILPIVFVHGFAGSASQFDSQAQRFVANGYPAEKLRAYEHDGAGLDIPGFAEELDGVIDGVLEEFGTEQVHLIGHSRGTSVANLYLGEPERAAKVSKVILLDGRDCMDVVPCDAPNQAELPGQKHVEVATSAESFARQYEFLFGEPPEVVDIVAEDGPVEISGRAVSFPANTGRDGATLHVYEVATATGARVSEEPLATFTVGADGAWGPLEVDPAKHYELTLSSAESDVTQHFYFQRFLRSTKFVRLLSGSPDSPTRVNTNVGPDHAALTILRMREWTGDDVMSVMLTSESAGGLTIDNVLTPDVTRDGADIALYLHDDAATPKESTLTPLPYFPDQPFQTGADVYMPAATPTDGSITLTSLPRGDSSKPQKISFPNWSSDAHMIMVMFADFAQPDG